MHAPFCGGVAVVNGRDVVVARLAMNTRSPWFGFEFGHDTAAGSTHWSWYGPNGVPELMKGTLLGIQLTPKSSVYETVIALVVTIVFNGTGSAFRTTTIRYKLGTAQRSSKSLSGP